MNTDQILLIVGIGLMAAGCVVIVVSLVRDIRAERRAKRKLARYMQVINQRFEPPTFPGKVEDKTTTTNSGGSNV